MPGYISLHRDIQKHWLYEEERIFSRYEAWLDILMRVNHTEGKVTHGGTVEIIPRGSTIWSMGDMEKHWGWSNRKVKRFLICLEADQMLTVKSTTKKTYLTVINYDFYQDTNSNKAPPMHQQSTTEAFQKHTNNNVNNEKEEKPKASRKRVYDESDVAYRSAHYLYEQILTHSPDYKKPDLQSWADDMRKLIELDKKEPINIARVIEWAVKDSFWKSNILSASKLRLKWDTLSLQMNRGDGNAKSWRNARGHTEADYQAAQRDADLPTIIRPSGNQLSEVQRQRIDERIRNT